MEALFRAYLANLKLGAQILGAIVIAALVTSAIGKLILLIPGIDADAREYIGPMVFIVCFVGVVWGYDRYRRWRFFKNLGKSN